MIAVKEKNTVAFNDLRTPLFFALGLLYAILTYAISMRLETLPINDFGPHAAAVYDVWIPEGFVSFFQSTPYPGWHAVLRFIALFGFSEAVSVAITCAFFNFLTAVIVFFAFDYAFGKEKAVFTILGGCVCLTATAIYFPLFNPEIYIGQGSPTVWHNPTYNAVKPIALITVLLFTRSISERKITLKGGILLSLLILLGVLLKPSFFLILVPAALVYAFIDYLRFRDMGFILRVALSFAPAVALLALQYLMLFGSSDSSSGIILAFLEVWGHSSPNVIVSLLLLWAFIVYVVFVCGETIFSKASSYLFPILILLIGLLEQSFLAEAGDRMFHGNFGWGYCLATFIGWFYMVKIFFEEAFIEKKLPKVLIVIGVVLFILHFASGGYYYLHLLLGASHAPF